MSEVPEVAGEAKPPKSHQIPFFINGEKFETRDDTLTVAEILAFVGKSPAEWYVVEKHGREQIEYRDGETVKIKSGVHLLTVSTGPTPVS